METINIAKIIKSLTGDLIWNLILIIITTMPTWIVINELKEKWKTIRRKNKLIKESLLAINSYYEIGNAKGILKEIKKEIIVLENDDNIYYIPLKEVLNKTILKPKDKGDKNDGNE